MWNHYETLSLSSTSLFDQKMQMITATEKEVKCILFAKSLSAKRSGPKSNSVFSRIIKIFSKEDKIISYSKENNINNELLVSITKTFKELWSHHSTSYFVTSKVKIDCLCFWVKELHGIQSEIVIDIEKNIRKKREEILATNRESFKKYQIESTINFRKIELEIIEEIDRRYGNYIT